MVQLDLRETSGWVDQRLTRAEADLLAASDLVDVRPVPGTSAVWEVRARDAVGAALISSADARVDLRVSPKIDVRRLIFLMGYAATPGSWRTDWVDFPAMAGLPAAVGEALARLADRALRAGILQGYLSTQDSGQTVRGRVRHVDQMRRHLGHLLPVEVTFDDYTVDIAENRIIKAALRRMLRVPDVPSLTRKRLHRVLHRLTDVSDLVRGAPPPPWAPSRLNRRYEPALRLSELVLSGTSFDLARGGVRASGFMLWMPRLFEDFVTVALGRELEKRLGGRAVMQDNRWRLDADGQVALRPDLTWYPTASGRRGVTAPEHAGLGTLPQAGVGIVMDAKYKAEKYQGFPNADVYQLLAYCTSLGLHRGHLVYAKGNEAGATFRIPGAGPDAGGVTIEAHTLDLDTEPEALLGQIAGLSEVMGAHVGVRRQPGWPS